MPPRRRFRSFGLAACAVLALAACDRGGGADRPPERGDRAVAKVDGKTVWASDVKREAVAQGLIGQGEPFDPSQGQFQQVLDQVIDQKLLAAEAQRRKLDKDPSAQRRLTAARERILGDMLVETMVADAVNDDAVKALYAEQQKLAKRSEEVRARQILTATSAEADALRKLLASGASFEALAMERSLDAGTRFNGGDMGYFTLDVMPEAYVAALQNAKPGAVVGPIAVDNGYALVKVEDRRPEKPIDLEAARPQIVRFLTYDQVRDLLEKLRSKAKVESLLKPQEGAPRIPPPADAAKLGPSPPPPAKAKP